MKFTWTETDIIAGRVVCMNQIDRPDFEHMVTTMYKIGYLPSADTDRKYCMISLADGMIQDPLTKKQVAKELNRLNMMPMPHQWIINTFNQMRDSYQGL